MPEIFRAFGFSFFFYSREHMPIHVHVEGADGAAKFELQDGKFVLVKSFGLKGSEIKKITAMIDDNTDISSSIGITTSKANKYG